VPHRDLRSFLATLEGRGLLRRVTREVDRDWEVAAVCRVLFQRYPRERRPALLFERVRGSDVPIAAGVVGGSPAIYAAVLELEPEHLLRDVAARWAEAVARPLEPVVVGSGPCQEVVLRGDEADATRFPHPMWTVGEDPGYFLTAPCVISADPETGQRNVGTYRNQIKGPRRMGVHLGSGARHLARHVAANERQGRPTPVAIALGGDPIVSLVSASAVPNDCDELAVAGALLGRPLEVVRCVTQDLHVPAASEIVFEGFIPAGVREPEGPFGEYAGYMAAHGMAPVIELTAITHRRDPIYHSFISQMPPSESSLIRSVGRESSIFAHLRDRLRLPVRDVHLAEAGGAAAFLAISIDKRYPGAVWQAAWGAWANEPTFGKFTVVVDDDVDVRDPFQLQWAMSFRVQPERDVHVVRETPAVVNDPSVAPPDVPKDQRQRASKVLIDATRKHAFPALAIPPSDHLARVAADWESYGLGQLPAT
jgi:UbiD family decarboxylase